MRKVDNVIARCVLRARENQRFSSRAILARIYRRNRWIRRIIPAGIRQLSSKICLARLRMENEQRSLRDVFTGIYRDSAWGGKTGQYFSGSGSIGYGASLYTDIVKEFIARKGIHSVVDLGCGDFRVGSRIRSAGVRYIGVDIVDDLVKRNQEEYGAEDVTFECLDIVSDKLPDADLCLIRQVLQHLSNSEIMSILPKLKKYKYVLITEHYPAPSVRTIPNRDKPHGADIRVYDDSAVYLDLPPFNMPVAEVMLDADAGEYLLRQGERIKTFLLVN